MSGKLDTETLTALLDRKRACLTQLRDLGVTQCALAAGGALGELLQLLAVKQEVLRKLQDVQDALAPFREQDPERRSWASAARRAAAAKIVADCDDLLAQIAQQERTSESDLRLRRDEAAQQLAGVHSASSARDAYGSYDRPAVGQLDLSSER